MKNVKRFVNKSGNALELESFDNGDVSVHIIVPVPGSEGCFNEVGFFLNENEVDELQPWLLRQSIQEKV